LLILHFHFKITCFYFNIDIVAKTQTTERYITIYFKPTLKKALDQQTVQHPFSAYATYAS